MVFTAVSPTEFTLSEQGENGTIVATTFSLRTKLSIWQLGKITKAVSQVTKQCGKQVTALLGGLMAAVSEDETDPTKREDSLAKIATSISAAMGGDSDLADVTFVDSVADVLIYIVDNSLLEMVTAVLYLNGTSNEAKLSDETLKARMLAMQNVPMEYLIDGIKDFFGKRGKLLRPTPSPFSVKTETTSTSKEMSSSTSTSGSLTLSPTAG